MAGARSRATARARFKKTEPLDLQDLQQAPRREVPSVTTLRIVSVGKNNAARSGSTVQIGATIHRVHVDSVSQPVAPRVIYATAETGQPKPRERAVRVIDMHSQTSVIEPPHETLAELQMRAARALSGMQAGLHSLKTQGIDIKKLSKSSLAWAVAVGVYALVLFMLALLTS